MDTGATAWMLAAASLVLLMTPGLALFYGGMSRSKSVLNMMMMSFGAMGVVGLVYVLWGWSMSFGGTNVAGIVGNPFQHFALAGVIYGPGGEFALNANNYPVIVDVAFQVTFAIITVALISGAIADRARFSTWMVFTAIWVTLVYFPMAHMVWNKGLLSPDGPFGGIAAPIDFAGGTVVHINAGMAGLVLALIIGRRRGFAAVPMKPHNLPLTMLGAGLLWFGWFGFNAGSAFGANGTAGLAWVNTTSATAAAMLGWLLTEKIRDGHATSLGAASGVVAGLVAITPAAGALSPGGAIILGLAAGALCALAVGLKYRFGYDDSLDVVGVHLVGGLVGTVAIGFLSTTTGVFYGGGFAQLLVQVIIAVAAVIFSGVMTTIIGLALKAAMGWRVREEVEVVGIDQFEHGESAYEGITAGRFATEASVGAARTNPEAARTTTEANA
ncbi:ammonium transporter [Georgenia thermotolerans]|uniref:Ammonium transporter n=1 Tax=Georgenia thermotolerans TaxID=527326 RepID=A0A7J5UIY6_9MICO|nr:ammonium transporter [Georgenia thermotolerans]KAE8762347.1 ammonium transporter [Georgenia thermotolerans]